MAGRRQRFCFEDSAQPPLRDIGPYPDVVTEAHRFGEWWRQQMSRQFPLDAMVLRLLIEGDPGGEPEVSVELDFDADWTAVHRIVREKGSWIACPDVWYHPRRDGVTGQPTARQRRQANPDRHRHRIAELRDQAIALDDRSPPPSRTATSSVNYWSTAGT